MVSQNNPAEWVEKAAQQCREIFLKKLSRYGASFSEMRSSTLNDLLMIKSMRILSLENNNKEVDETIIETWQAIANYSVIATMMLNGIDEKDYRNAYDIFINNRKYIREGKSNDYNHAWMKMEPTSFVDIIHTKIMRNKVMLNKEHAMLPHILDNLIDIYNYAVFAIARLVLDEQK